MIPATVPTRPAAAWHLTVSVPKRIALAIEAALADRFEAVSAFEIDGPSGLWRVDAYAGAEPDRAALGIAMALAARAAGALAEPAWTLEALPPTDWLAETYARFPPIRLGRFFIHGSHVGEPVPPSAIGLMIDAATAFGSGEHPTTAGCLAAVEDYAKTKAPGGRARALDMGAGTGILAIAVAKQLRWPVLAADIDPESVRVGRVNARANRVAGRVRVIPSAGYAAPEIARTGPFDLVLANILARPLVAMAKDLRRALGPGGTAVLSGLLTRQEPMVLSAHRLQGLVLARRWRRGAWSTLVLRRPRRPGRAERTGLRKR